MIKYFLSLILIISAAGSNHLHAQIHDSTQKEVYRVAILAPLYLDSAFTGGQLRYQKTIPKLMMPGVEFIQGAQIAFDTLELNGKKVEAYIYDSKASFLNVSWLIRNRKFDSIDLIIGSVKEPEFGVLSKFAGQRKIPFISSTYPNDGGIRNNGYVTILNSTLRSHCEGIFSYLVQKHGTDNIYLIKKKNDNRVDNYFKALNSAEGQPLLKMKTIMLDSSISAYGLKNLIDTTRPAVIIGASLDETFSIKLAEACYPVSKTNTLSLIGMPNWDGFRGFYKKDAFKDFPIKFTTPHYDAKAKEFTQFLSEKYFKLYRADPTDMAYKGFESAYYFTRILLKYNKQFMDKLNEPSLAPFHDFNLRPVYFNKESSMPDYYENKQLFIMQILNGHIVRQW